MLFLLGHQRKVLEGMLNPLRSGHYANIYLNLAQSAYAGQPVSFAHLLGKRPVRVDYARARVHHGHQHERLGRAGDPVVYLLPDLLAVNRGESGFQAYVLIDTPDVNDATQAYFVVRGTETLRPTDPDWLQNNLPFAFNQTLPGQTNAALTAWRTAAAHLPATATWNFCGHSLGTMVTVSLLAQLTVSELARAGQIVLFNGPDMAGALDAAQRERLRGLTAQGQLHYYLASHDIISAYNRAAPSGIGQVHYIAAPTNDTRLPSVAAHAFDQYTVNRDGTIAEDASPENLAYAARLATGLTQVFAEVAAGREAVSEHARQLTELFDRLPTDW